MLVIEFIEMFVDEHDQYFELWDNKKEETIFKGYKEDLPEELEEATITSIDNIYKGANGITLNIDID